jgi:hypothetical protein
MTTTKAECDLLSIGTLASHLHVTVRAIEHAAEQLGIAPAWRLNLIPHFDGAQAEAIRQHLEAAK